MSVNAISPLATASGTSSPAASGTSGTASSSQSLTGSASSMQNEFLQLLTTQLSNQDPLDPVDETDMLSQLAQFSSLEQIQNLNTTMTGAASFSGLTQSASLIGQYVTTTASNGSAGPSGQVSGVVMTNGEPYLQIGSSQVLASQVSTISSTAPSTSSGSSTGS